MAGIKVEIQIKRVCFRPDLKTNACGDGSGGVVDDTVRSGGSIG